MLSHPCALGLSPCSFAAGAGQSEQSPNETEQGEAVMWCHAMRRGGSDEESRVGPGRGGGGSD